MEKIGFWSGIVGAWPLCLLALTVNASAAGIVCAKASSPVERAICADEQLLRLDGSLAEIHAHLQRALPDQAAGLRRAQKDWLLSRDQCAGNSSCLEQLYRERIGVLSTQWQATVATTMPDQTDRQALQVLRAAVETRLQSDREFPLEKTLDALRIRQGMTHFSNTPDAGADDSVARFPRHRPPGVTTDEWQALRNSRIDGDGEHGQASYTLHDLDGDGRRDLIVDSYVGGTGLFNYISVLRRQGDRFSGAHAANASLYSLNGRGSNQQAVWIRLAGRVYAVYRNSVYGRDDLYLLRPFGLPGKVPTLTLRYRYDWSVPTEQRGDGRPPFTLDASTHAALTRALAGFVRQDSAGAGAPDELLCPMPEGADPASRSRYVGFGAGHYTYEMLGDVPVWIGQECLLGRVVDWFGNYAADSGLFAALWTRHPETDEERSFELRARRQVSKLESRFGPVEGDMGR